MGPRVGYSTARSRSNAYVSKCFVFCWLTTYRKFGSMTLNFQHSRVKLRTTSLSGLTTNQPQKVRVAARNEADVTAGCSHRLQWRTLCYILDTVSTKKHCLFLLFSNKGYLLQSTLAGGQSHPVAQNFSSRIGCLTRR